MADLAGRCLCGAVTWHYNGAVLWAGHCHCDSCRRATGAPFASFFGAVRADVRFSGEMAERFSSHGAVRRQFCGTCGSQMTYQNEIWPTETHLYAASLNDPEMFEPRAHFHWAERLDWLDLVDNLPKYAGSADGAAPLE